LYRTHFGILAHQLHVDIVFVVNGLSELRPDLLSVVEDGVGDGGRESGEGQSVTE
jgi:hypothetical protein